MLAGEPLSQVGAARFEFEVGTVTAWAYTDDLCGIGDPDPWVCVACVEDLGEYRPDRFPTLQDYRRLCQNSPKRSKSSSCGGCAQNKVRGIMLMVERTNLLGSEAGGRRLTAMFARMSTLEGPPDQLDEGLPYVREQVLPLMQQQDGFKGFIALGDRQSRKLVGVSLWESEQAMRASEEVGDRTRSESAEAVSAAVAGVERYDVGLFEVSR